MSVLKIAGLICMIAGGAGVGYSMSVQVGRRYQQLQELQRMVAFLMGEITYASTPLPEALKHAAQRLEEPFASFLNELAKEMMRFPSKTFAKLFSQNVYHYLKGSSLDKKDLEMLCHMGTSLGYLDRDMQLRTLQLYETELKQEMLTVYETMPGRKNLYQTLGIMGGLFLVILFL